MFPLVVALKDEAEGKLRKKAEGADTPWEQYLNKKKSKKKSEQKKKRDSKKASKAQPEEADVKDNEKEAKSSPKVRRLLHRMH